MSSINFKTDTLVKNFKNAIKAIQHCKHDSKTYFLYKSKFNIDKNVDRYIKQIISEIMMQDIIANNFSKKHVSSKVIEILEKLYDENAFNLSKEEFKNRYFELIENFENEINNTIKNDFNEFEFISHIQNLTLPREIKIGEVVLFPYDSSNSPLAYVNENKYVDDDFLEMGKFMRGLLLMVLKIMLLKNLKLKLRWH